MPRAATEVSDGGEVELRDGLTRCGRYRRSFWHIGGSGWEIVEDVRVSMGVSEEISVGLGPWPEL